MALHHETAGAGFDLWDAWSSKGETYPGTDALRRRWESFGRERPSQPVTARSLVKAGAERGIHLAADPRAVDADAKSGKPSRFQVIPAASFAALPPTRWIVKGLLPQAELAVLYGESGSGKSFVVLDIALAIARGVPWRGLRVRQGRVVYIAAEGAGGVRGRLAAYAKHNGVDLAGVDLSVIADVPNLLDKTDAAALARAIGQADVVVLDTLAQATPGGNENSSEDMGRALAHAKAIHRATGALVLIIHHAGKDASRGARGWSGIRAALDAELEVVRMPVGRLLRTTKQKDGDDRSSWGFDLEVVNLGVDEDGDVVSSCVVTEATVADQGLARKLGPIEKAIAEAVARNDGDAPVEVVISEVVETIAAPAEGARDTRRDRVRRALRALCEGQDAPFWMADGRIERL
jgi:RecA/RadA recombinase